MAPSLPAHVAGYWLSAAATQAVLGALAARGFEARVVGGAVRNALLGRPVADVDIATTATPAQVMAAADAAGLKWLPTGVKHGTVTVMSSGEPFEVTTLRADVETDGRHAKVAFTGDWAADAARRDLTINALYCDADGRLFDPLGGLGDVMERRVRFIGDACARIREDYLRILRFFRFSAEYGVGTPDADGMAAAVAERAGLVRLSAERVGAELKRLLAAPLAVAVIDAMAGHGLVTAILPVAPRVGIMARLGAIEAGIGRASDPMLRLAALGVAVDEDAQRLAARLRLSSDEREVLAGSLLPGLDPGAHERQHRLSLYRHGSPTFERSVLLAWAMSGADAGDPSWRALLDMPARWQPPAMPFTGRDVIVRGVPAGPRVGEILAAFEAWWTANDFAADPLAQTAALDRLVGGA